MQPLDKWIVIDVALAKVMAIGDTETECALRLRRLYPTLPNAEMADTGFAVVPARITFELLPMPTCSMRFSQQLPLPSVPDTQGVQP